MQDGLQRGQPARYRLYVLPAGAMQPWEASTDAGYGICADSPPGNEGGLARIACLAPARLGAGVGSEMVPGELWFSGCRTAWVQFPWSRLREASQAEHGVRSHKLDLAQICAPVVSERMR